MEILDVKILTCGNPRLVTTLDFMKKLSRGYSVYQTLGIVKKQKSYWLCPWMAEGSLYALKKRTFLQYVLVSCESSWERTSIFTGKGVLCAVMNIFTTYLLVFLLAVSPSWKRTHIFIGKLCVVMHIIHGTWFGARICLAIVQYVQLPHIALIGAGTVLYTMGAETSVFTTARIALLPDKLLATTPWAMGRNSADDSTIYRLSGSGAPTFEYSYLNLKQKRESILLKLIIKSVFHCQYYLKWRIITLKWDHNKVLGGLIRRVQCHAHTYNASRNTR